VTIYGAGGPGRVAIVSGSRIIGYASEAGFEPVPVECGTHFTPAEIADRLGVEVRWRSELPGQSAGERAS